MLYSFHEKLRVTELRNLRSLTLASAIIVIIVGFIFEFSYHDSLILASGISCSTILICCYFLSFYSVSFKRHFSNIAFYEVFLINIWALLVIWQRNFEIDILLPVSISVFTFSLVFNSSYKSLVFVFSITTALLILMLLKGNWQNHFTILILSLYAGAFLSQQILKRKAEFHSEIQKKEKLYTSLVENMNDGLLYLDQQQKISFVNDKFFQITGYRRDEVIGNSISKFTPVPAAFSQPVRIKEGTFSFIKGESQILKKNGELIWVQSKSAIQNDEEGSSGTMLMYSDISALKAVQATLKKKEEGYRTFIEQSQVGIWRADYAEPIPVSLPVETQISLLLDTGMISECNEFMVRMYGYSSQEDLIGKRIRDFYLIENNYDESRARELIQKFISNNYRTRNTESKEHDKQGNIRYMLNNNIGIVENNCLVRTWGIQTDVTERKATEKKLIETTHELDTFFYKASHDLKGPLASVMGIVHLARLDSQNEVTDKYFKMIETSVKRLDRTLMDLIDLASTRKTTSKQTQIQIRNLIDEIMDSLKSVPDFEKIKFEIKVNTDSQLTGDKVLIYSVFQNIIHNAATYCNPENPVVNINVSSSINGTFLIVKDNGKGINNEIKDKVFEMFYRGHPNSTGAGLGLFIVKNALEKLNGTINFETSPDEGTTFTVFIPQSYTDNNTL